MPAGIPLSAPNSKFIKRVLFRGMQGKDVRYLQEVLEELNQYYRFCPAKSLEASGYYGDETHKHVKFFQYFADLLPDGFYEKQTHEALEATYKNYLAELGSKLQMTAPSKQRAY